jgi:hypothetical protein
MRNSSLLELLEVDEHHAIGTAFNMAFALWYKETQLHAFRRLDRALMKLVLSYPEGVGVCQIIEPNAVPPSAETRAEITKMMQNGGGGQLKHYSLTFEGTGFKAASIRAVVSASHMVARTKSQLAVFSTLGAAAAWHAGQQGLIGRMENAADISNVVRQLRAEYSQHMAKATKSQSTT